MLLLLDWLNAKFEFIVGDITLDADNGDFTGLVFALFIWFIDTDGPFEFFLPIKLSKSILTLLHVDPTTVGCCCFLVLSLLDVPLLFDELNDNGADGCSILP